MFLWLEYQKQAKNHEKAKYRDAKRTQKEARGHADLDIRIKAKSPEVIKNNFRRNTIEVCNKAKSERKRAEITKIKNEERIPGEARTLEKLQF